MAELHSNLYFKHPDLSKHTLVVELFKTFDLNSERSQEPEKHFIELATEINPTDGHELANSLLEAFKSEFYDEFGSESLWEADNGYCGSHWVNGSTGDDIQEALISFLYELCPSIHAQSWGCGDDDPWEYWFKYEEGNVIRFDDCPYEGNDNYLFGTVYRWWHETMPKGIKEGFLSSDDSECVNTVNQEAYEEWIEELKQPAPVEDEDSYEPPVYESIGPELSAIELKEIHDICEPALGSEMKKAAEAFVSISQLLVSLESKHQSGCEMDEENPEIFQELLDLGVDKLVSNPHAEHFNSYFQSILQAINDEVLLGTMIQIHDEVLDFVAVLLPLLEEEDVSDFFNQAIDSYEDFLVWKDFLVLMMSVSE